MVVKSLPNVDDAMGIELSPSHTTLHDPGDAVCTKAMVRNFAPDCWASVAGLCPVLDSKYGANVRAGMAWGATAVWASTLVVPATARVAATTTASICLDNLISALLTNRAAAPLRLPGMVV